MLRRTWSNRNSHSTLVGMQNSTLTLEGLQFLTKLNILLLYNSAITLLGIYPNDLKIYIHTKTCTQMPIAALLINAKTGKNQDVLQ